MNKLKVVKRIEPMGKLSTQKLQSPNDKDCTTFLVERDFFFSKEVLSAASHDFNEPLRTISGYCDLMLNNKNSDLPIKYKGWVEAIRSSASRAEKLTDAVSEFVSYELNDVNLNTKNLEALLMSTKKEAQLLYPKCDIQSQFQKIENITINTDSELFGAALLHVVKNACMYSSENHPKVYLSVNIDHTGLLSILVRNNGKKIPEKFKNRIFTPFFRLHSYHNVPGHGLGLPIAKKIMKNLNGDLYLENSSDEETCFILTHPLH